MDNTTGKKVDRMMPFKPPFYGVILIAFFVGALMHSAVFCGTALGMLLMLELVAYWQQRVQAKNTEPDLTPVFSLTHKFDGARAAISYLPMGPNVNIWYQNRLFVFVYDCKRKRYYVDEVRNGDGLGTWYTFSFAVQTEAINKLDELMRSE